MQRVRVTWNRVENPQEKRFRRVEPMGPLKFDCVSKRFVKTHFTRGRLFGIGALRSGHG